MEYVITYRSCNWPKYIVSVEDVVYGEFQEDEINEMHCFISQLKQIYGNNKVVWK